MPTYATTARRSLRKLLGTNKVKDIDAGIAALADDVDAALLVRSFGKCIIPTAETKTTTWGLMPTPDQVSGLVLPTDGLIFVGYQATWKEAFQNDARASLFLDGQQVLGADADFGGLAQFTARIDHASAVDVYVPLASYPMGLASKQGAPGTSAAYLGDSTTGQVLGGGRDLLGTQPVGGLAVLFAAAGTHDVNVRFSSGGSGLTVKDRKLWAWTLGF